jgi:hypothetical protein
LVRDLIPRWCRTKHIWPIYDCRWLTASRKIHMFCRLRWSNIKCDGFLSREFCRIGTNREDEVRHSAVFVSQVNYNQRAFTKNGCLICFLIDILHCVLVLDWRLMTLSTCSYQFIISSCHLNFKSKSVNCNELLGQMRLTQI